MKTPIGDGYAHILAMRAGKKPARRGGKHRAKRQRTPAGSDTRARMSEAAKRAWRERRASGDIWKYKGQR